MLFQRLHSKTNNVTYNYSAFSKEWKISTKMPDSSCISTFRSVLGYFSPMLWSKMGMLSLLLTISSRLSSLSTLSTPASALLVAASPKPVSSLVGSDFRFKY